MTTTKPSACLTRLENLLRVLKTVKPKAFDMGTFGRKTPCGTVGCLLGHAGLDPWFRRRGLRTSVMIDRTGDVVEDEGGVYLDVAIDGDPSVHATAGFFGIESTENISLFYEATHLFGAEGKREKAREIKDLLKKYKKASP